MTETEPDTFSADKYGRTTVKLHAIKVDDRMRQDLGNIEELAESIVENGLLHAIVVDDDFNLIAGGRRYAAFQKILESDNFKEAREEHEFIPFVRLGSLSGAQRKLLELEENLRRKQMSWQEKVLGLADYHNTAKREAFKAGEKWSQRETGDLFSVSQAHVSNALVLADELKKTDSPLWKLTTALEAMKMLAQRNYDTMALEAKRRLSDKRATVKGKANQAPVKLVGSTTPTTAPILPSKPKPASGPEEPRELISRDEVADMYFHGDSLEVLYDIRKSMVINHIVTDPPYGIPTKNMNMDSVYRIAKTHQIDENVALIMKFLTVAFEVIANDGFLCMWYDLEHHEKIRDFAEKVGWKVCHWPFVWAKTSNCQNNQAQYNITKAAETCMMFRRSEESIIKKKRDKNWVTCPAVSSKSHPFIKPPDVWNWLMETISIENQTIIDPFCGEGSMMLEGFKMSRICYGIEIEEIHIANGIQFLYDKLNLRGPKLITDAADLPL